MKDTIKLKDFLDFTYLSNLSFALDEEHGVFVGSKCVEKDNSYQMKLYLTDGDTVRQLTSHGKEQLYLWDDNETVLFANMRMRRIERLLKTERREPASIESAFMEERLLRLLPYHYR